VFDDRYEVLRKLGSGGMADVYLAHDQLLGRQVALKILSSRYANDEQFIERFRREASNAAGLNHPNIVQIYDRGEAGGTYYIAMEYLEGNSLKAIILKHAPLSPELIVSISIQIVEALRFAHRRDVIHRDIKPQNIIVDGEGRVKVTDFGIARAGSASTMTEAGSILGTAHYLSPEQAQGHPVEAASDLYSLGVVMYEMATGVLPFDGDNPVALAMRHVHDQPAPPTSIVPTTPKNLEAVILHALGKTPTERYLTAGEFLEDLRSVQKGEDVRFPTPFSEQTTRVMAMPAAAAAGEQLIQPTQVRPTQAPPLAPSAAVGRSLNSDLESEEPPQRRNVWPWVLVVILILALAGGGYAILSNWSGSRGDLVVVPKVVGLSESDAAKVLGARGFKMEVEGEQASADVIKGLVARQDPEDETKQVKGSTVSVWISSGAGTVTLPDVVGKTQVEAAQLLGSMGLKVKSQDQVSKDATVGTVLKQSPEADQEVEAGSTVTIVIAVAADTVTVPRLTGRTKDEAVSLIKGLKLTPSVKEVESTLAAGTVVEQRPQEGAEIAPGSEVTIYVSSASTRVKVPDVVGRSQAQATAKLKANGLSPRIMTRVTSDYPAGRVIEQNPSAGDEVEKGSSVTIIVSKSPAPSTTTTVAPTTTTTTETTTTSTTIQPSSTTTTTEF
jgi:serine/threonine protein kinase/beta-lactam-binding protein with PASTA domain